MTPTIILILALCSDTLASDLFTFVSDPPVNAGDIAACQSKDLLSCSVIQINFSALNETTLTLPGDCTVTFLDNPAEGSFTFEDNNGTTATFTRAQTKEGHFKLIGNVEYSDGRDFTLEPCRAFHGCHVWMEEDEQDWVDEDSKTVPVMEEEIRYAVLNRRTADPAKIQQGKDDSTTIATFSVMFYYTPEFAATTEDIPLFVSQVIAETNQGYINSQVPVRVRSHCIAAATLHDNGDAYAMLDEFGKYKPTEELLNSADAAALLVQDFDSCGIGCVGCFMYGSTITATKKSCALGYYSFGHEIGHNFGCMHDAKQGANSLYSYGLGKHISGPGVRTIMAYNAAGFSTRVNWWSNPDVMYQGAATGTEVENNARVLREHRFAFADIGDESNACEATTTTTTPAPTSATSGELKSTNFPSKYSNNVDTTETILVGAGKTVKINFSAMNIESHASCAYDYVTVIDGDGTVLLDKTCGTTVPAEFQSNSNKVNVIFHTDYSVKKSGWKLTWTLVSPPTGLVTSENYPSAYNNDLDKTYTVEVADGKRIQITFNDIDIEAHNSCAYDYVMIKDGDGSVVLPKACGSTKPADVTSVTNKVIVTFHSDYSVTKKGFKLTWTEV